MRDLGHGGVKPLGDDGLGAGSGVGCFSRKHLVQHGAERVEVASAIEIPLAHRLLGTHVGRRSDSEPGLGQLLGPGRVHCPGDAGVRPDRVTVFQQDVLGLDVPVNHVLGMRGRQRFCDLAGEAERIFNRQLLLAGQASGEGFSLDKGHDVEQVLGSPEILPGVRPGDARIVQRQDVGVTEVRGGLDLAEEPLRPDRRRQLGPQHLHRHFAAVLEVFGEVDGGHAPLAQLSLNAVGVGQCSGQAGDISHAGVMS